MQFLECAERTLSTLDEGVEELKRVSRGEGLIRLGLLRTLGVDYVPDVVSRFLAANSGKKIRFTFETGMTNQLLDGLSERKYDMVFASKPPAELGFTSVAVERQDLVLIVPRDHPLANRATPWTCARRCPTRRCTSQRLRPARRGGRALLPRGRAPKIAYEIDEDQVIAGFVARGFGIAVVPYMDMLLRLNVKIIQIASPVWERNFYMVTDDRTYMPPAVSSFRQFVLNGINW